MKTKELPINCAARNSVWVYPRATLPHFPGAPVIYETTSSHERPDIFSLPEGSDVTVELYGAAVSLRLEGERRRVQVRRFDHVTFPSEEEARHAFMRLWREVEMLESPAAIELAAERWLEASVEPCSLRRHLGLELLRTALPDMFVSLFAEPF